MIMILLLDQNDGVLRILVACHKHSKNLSHSDLFDVGQYEPLIKRALIHTDNQVGVLQELL